MRALDNCKGHDAVDSNRGEEQSQRRKQTENEHVEATWRNRIRNPLLHRHQAVDWLMAMECRHFATHYRREWQRIVRRAHSEIQRRHIAAGEQRLECRDVKFRTVLDIETAVLHISDDADNLVPLRLVVLKRDPLAECVAVRPELTREGVVHNCNLWLVR